MSRWGIVASLSVVLLGAILVAVARAATVDDVYEGLCKDVVHGSGTCTFVTNYSCDVPPGSLIFKDMEKITAKLTLPFIPDQCDELGTAGTITTTWTLLLRWGPGPIVPFGTHAGSFTWTEGPATGPDVIKGTMSGTFGCGTHRPPLLECELCRDNLHFEGRLTGTYVSGPTFSLYKGRGLPAPTISTTYAGYFNGELPNPDLKTTTVGVQMAIDGVYSFPCGT
jgi:hypothetical protein